MPVKQAMIDWFGPIIVEYYGGTEANGSTGDSEQWLAHPGSVGAPSRHAADPRRRRRRAAAGETGTVWFEGATNFAYYHDAAKTAEGRDASRAALDGRRRRHVDEDGYLYLTDRKTYMIISGGVNIYPQEIENLLVTHPQGPDAAVFGVPNEDLGEEVKAVVQLIPARARPGVEPSCWRLGQHLAVSSAPPIDFEDDFPGSPRQALQEVAAGPVLGRRHVPHRLRTRGRDS